MILRLSTIEISSMSVHPKNHKSEVESELTMVLFKKARLGFILFSAPKLRYKSIMFGLKLDVWIPDSGTALKMIKFTCGK